MQKAIELAKLNGAVFAGWNEYKGIRTKVSSSTLYGMERRDLLVITVGPDGGMMGRLTTTGLAVQIEMSKEDQ
jgi:hypothetical protein